MYQSKKIKEIIIDIEDNIVYLPALQRKFVWKKPQIELLFDSLMKNYPIGTFLFWKLKSKDAQNYVFYEFLKEYDERNPYNKRKQGAFLKPEITGILDGQQRLSSIYIALQGTHTEKAPYMRWANVNAFKPTSLYLNLLALPYYIAKNNEIEIYEDRNFEFRFIIEKDANDLISRKIRTHNEDGKETERLDIMYWFKVGDILKWAKDPEFDEIIEKFIRDCESEEQVNAIRKNKRFIRKALDILHKRIVDEPLINYFEVDKTDLEDILKIFTRVNSGGTPLSKTDLLFSTIVATWDDGREEIENLLKTINSKGDGFDFSNEFLMRCCLVITDAPVLYKVNSFKPENVEKIKTQWDNIAKAISKTVDLLVEFGFSSSVLTSQNATIIIVYYIFKGGTINKEVNKDIKKYLIHALINRIYGTTQESVLSSLRNFFRKKIETKEGAVDYTIKSNTFSFNELLKIELPARKSFYITEDEIEGFLSFSKGIESFFALSLLYPNLRYKEVQFHQDHIHPAALFNDDTFDSLGIPEEQRQEWLNKKNLLPNLQLMEGRQNESKNSKEFKIWLKTMDKSQQKHFFQSNYIPQKFDYSFSNFESFFEKRKEMLRKALLKVFAINNDIPKDASLLSEEPNENGGI